MIVNKNTLKEKTLPTITGILSQDYIAMCGFILATIFSLVCIVGISLGKIMHPTLANLAPFIIIIGYLVAYFRVIGILKIFENGEKVTAKIMTKYHDRNCIKLEYSYKYKEIHYQTKFYATGGNYLRKLNVGHNTEVILNPNSPEKALIHKIFF